MAPTTFSRSHCKLQDARALVIGGSSGIGFGVCEALLQHGAYVFLCSSQPHHISNAVQRLLSKFPLAEGRLEGIVCDLSSAEKVETQVQGLFDTIAAKGVILDHVVYTAGDDITLGNIEEFKLAEIQKAGMVRFFGPLLVAQHLSRAMTQSTASSFTITTGGLHQRPRKGWAIMMSYLSGLEGMTRALARDLAPVRVNLVGPGPVDTERWYSHRETADVDDLKRSLARATVTSQIADVQDVVEAYLYLMKDKNMTGGSVYTNGGALLA
ncbi:hypothetical protein M409DRAFT_65535 [Zasmidium cellare ATCC 36951]|uniref:Uncharacterized protein n=1 Tax=Zasmidium cellare ATCC 36951 TaxID=1080233 RepID=A0A6A6CR92_ZASCE|nr:uncharacterized protein M409DRAFT_65535 [Zasmidium cellare ATCC 36951]KAF2168660.1 hypothetical protein M409DRAFT_65535 [Zasmidium cellare ATCC 36951]